MKTTLTLPDDEFLAAEKLARQLDIGRGELYRTAISEFVLRHSEGRITDRLNEVYAERPNVVDGGLAALRAGWEADEQW